MKRKLIVGITVGLLSALSIVGATFANESEKNKESFQARVAEILGIEQDTYSAAIKTAKEEFKIIAQEKRLEDLKEKLSSAVSEGKITEEEANQKLDSMTEIQEWINSEPSSMEIVKEAKKNLEMKEYTSDEMLALLLSDGTISQEQHDEITNWINSKPEGMKNIKEKKGKGRMMGKYDKNHMKGQKKSEISRTSLNNLEIKLTNAVALGEISKEDAEIKLAAIDAEKNCDKEKATNDIAKDNISNEQIRMMIFDAIESGKITDGEAKEKILHLASK